MLCKRNFQPRCYNCIAYPLLVPCDGEETEALGLSKKPQGGEGLPTLGGQARVLVPRAWFYSQTHLTSGSAPYHPVTCYERTVVKSVKSQVGVLQVRDA